MKLQDYLEDNSDIIGEFTSELKNGLYNSRGSYKPSTYFSPSSMKCGRNMYYKKRGITPEDGYTPYFMVGIQEIGDFRHHKLQSIISQLCYDGFEWVDIEEYIKIKELNDIHYNGQDGFEAILKDKKNHLSFRCDGLLKINGIYYLLEIKTESHLKFDKRKEVAKEHLAQITAYGLALEVDKAIFIYENRSNSMLKTFEIDIPLKDKMELQDKIKDVLCHDLMNTPPPAEKSSINCSYCRYKTECESDGD